MDTILLAEDIVRNRLKPGIDLESLFCLPGIYPFNMSMDIDLQLSIFIESNK
jgi:hypothetical protein